LLLKTTKSFLLFFNFADNDDDDDADADDDDKQAHYFKLSLLEKKFS